MRLSDRNLNGRTVIAADGRAVGQVAALFLDSDDWRIESILVELRREAAELLGAPHSMFRSGTVEVPTALVQSVGDAVVLSVPTADLRQVLPAQGEGASPP